MTISDRLKKFDILNNADTGAMLISPELAALCSDLTHLLSKKIASIPVWFEYSEEEQKELILNFLNTKLNEQFEEIKLTPSEKERICSAFFKSVYGFGSLDFLISQENVSKIFVDSPQDVYMEVLGRIEKTDVIIDEKQFNSLISRLVSLSQKQSAVITFRFNNLLVTILREPVCSTKLILKKVSDIKFDFGFFERRDILNSDISRFLRTVLGNKKRIMISSPVQCGKTAFVNSFVNEIPDTARVVLFEEGALINSNHNGLNRFDVEDLQEKEQRDLITAALYYRPDFIFSDINDIAFNLEISDLLSKQSGFISTVRANSISEAISFYTSVLVSKLKCTEKLAKIQFAKDIDYIVQLDKNEEYFNIKSIVAVSQNKSGTPVLTEVLVFKSGEYKYNFEELQNIEDIEEKSVQKQISTECLSQPARKFSFSSRLLEM